jgi:Leucine-rich repeat (LRR) protein
MPVVPGHQNTHTHATNDPSSGNPQHTRRKGGVLNSLFPRTAHRAAEKLAEHIKNMQAPADTQYMEGISAINNVRSKRALTHQLDVWLEAAPLNEYASRETALDRIIEGIVNQSASLDLKGLELSELPRQVFQFMPSLRTLDLRDNTLKSLDTQSFERLESLNVSRNQLKTLDLSGCHRLQYLYSSDNQLTELNLSNCRQLQHLDSSRNQLTSMNLAGCNQLQVVDCSSNALTALNLRDCIYLESLYAQSNTELFSLSPPEEEEGRELTYIDLSETDIRLENLPSEIMNIQGIIEPFGSYTERHLPHWIAAAPFSEEAAREIAAQRIRECISNENRALDLSGLRLTSLPENTLKTITSLNELNISNNALINFDSYAFRRLHILNISGNRINHLNFNGCNQLQRLECSGNPLVILDFSDCEQLTHIDARWNRNLRNLIWPNLLLPEVIALRDIKLEGCGLIFENLPEELRNSQHIWIDINPFALNLCAWQAAAPIEEQAAIEIAKQQIVECKINDCTALNLSGLALTSLPENVFQHLGSLRLLNISNNNLTVVDFSQHDMPLMRLLAHSNPLLTDLRLHERTPLNHLTLADTGIAFETLPQIIREKEDIWIDILGPYVEPHIQAWENAAGIGEESTVRAIAANRIRACILDRGMNLDLSNLGITSLPENVLQHIPSLRILDLRNNWGPNRNKFFSLNLNSCKRLTDLNISNNYMASILRPNLNLSGFTKLRQFICSHTKFWNIDLSGCNPSFRIVAL